MDAITLTQLTPLKTGGGGGEGRGDDDVSSVGDSANTKSSIVANKFAMLPLSSLLSPPPPHFSFPSFMSHLQKRADNVNEMTPV